MVCLKAPIADISDEELQKVTNELQQEAAILANLAHPFTIKLIGTGRMPSTGGKLLPFLAINWLSGKPSILCLSLRRHSCVANCLA